jgi:hypothetical protein
MLSRTLSIIRSLGICIRRIAVLSSLRRRNLHSYVLSCVFLNRGVCAEVGADGFAIRSVWSESACSRRDPSEKAAALLGKKGCYPPDGIESSKKSKRVAPTSVAPSYLGGISSRARVCYVHTSHTGPNLLGGEVWDMVVNSKEGVSQLLLSSVLLP